MKRAIAVVGSQFGDEGKGLMVDYFCRQAKDTPIVVRYNGGAQAGHTVVTPEGKRHVFHHFGAGTLAGADTYLSEHFIVNPHAALKEREELNYNKLINVHPHARVTTPYDMFVNQKIEESQRHGSCGMGINETMVRHSKSRIARLSAIELDGAGLEGKMEAIQYYSIGRLADFGLITRDVLDWIMNPSVFKIAIEECKQFAQLAYFITDPVLQYNRDIIFEGAQGLLLDQDNKRFFPHVTHSKTGLHNVIDICQKAGIEHLDACYVARSYLTRHGAGELPGEDPNLWYKDNTNVSNEWQGNLRFAPQDWDLLNQTIADDFNPNSSKGVDCDVSIAITHLDQCKADALKYLGVRTLIDYESYGPTWKDVQCLRSEKAA